MSDDRDGSNSKIVVVDKSDSELFGHKNRIWEIRFSSDDSLLFSGAEDGCLITWDLATSNRFSEIKVLSGNILHILLLYYCLNSRTDISLFIERRKITRGMKITLVDSQYLE